MTSKKPPAQINPPEPHDPYRLRALEQILESMNNGKFRGEVQSDLNELLSAMDTHREDYPGAPCKASIALKIEFDVKPNGDTAMIGACEIKRPKPPAATGSAYLGDGGELSLGTPMMRRMHRPVRDVGSYDPDTGEIRDVE